MRVGVLDKEISESAQLLDFCEVVGLSEMIINNNQSQVKNQVKHAEV